MKVPVQKTAPPPAATLVLSLLRRPCRCPALPGLGSAAHAGRVTARIALQPSALGGAGAACLEVSPTQLLVADSRGGLHLFSCLLAGGQLQPPALLASAPSARGRSGEPACLELLPHSALAHGPAALLVDGHGRLLLYRLHEHKVEGTACCAALAGRGARKRATIKAHGAQGLHHHGAALLP